MEKHELIILILLFFLTLSKIYAFLSILKNLRTRSSIKENQKVFVIAKIECIFRCNQDGAFALHRHLTVQIM